MQTDQPPSQTYKPFAVTVSPSRGEPSRAVVLGGGGPVGVGWLIGMLLGLRDAGVNLDDADTVVGTSAGSIVRMASRRVRVPTTRSSSRPPAAVPRSTNVALVELICPTSR